MAWLLVIIRKLFKARDAKMDRGKWSLTLVAVLLSAVALLPGWTAAQDSAAQNVTGEALVGSEEPATASAPPTPEIGGRLGVAPLTVDTGRLWPEFTPAALTWVAVVVIGVLILQTRPLVRWHNFDGLMLALAAVLLPLRNNADVIPGDPTGQSVRWWVYLLLLLIGLYWLARGLRLLLARTAPTLKPNVSESGMVVLVAAGLIVAMATIAQAPISAGSRDGLIGGICMEATGKLPYGDAVRYDARSPLLYALHAGAVELVEPVCEMDDKPVAMRWGNRGQWLNQEAWETADFTAVRLLNALLFVLLFGALAGIGHRQHSVVMGQALVAIVCLFPGALECFTRPEIMLPTTLLAWSIAFVTVPGVGGLLSVLLAVLAGLAWPWAWLALPALLAYFLRRGWHALGAVVGLLVGVAAAMIGITTLVAPTLPRHDGALAEAGMPPHYAARLSDDGTVVIEHHRSGADVAATFKSPLWKFLLEREAVRIDAADTQPLLPNGAGSIMYRDVVTTEGAARVLQQDYRAALATAPITTRGWVALRTLLEATWKPAVGPERPLAGMWELWSAGGSGSARLWAQLRRIGKVVVGLLALLTAFLLLRGPRGELRQLVGALLVVSAATLLISMMGVATNWVWLMPTAMAALAAKRPSVVPKPTPPEAGLSPFESGPAPRITVEN